jgi:tryptophan halogenase
MSARMGASDLMNQVRALAAPFGLERSVKIVPGALLEDRFLVSLHRSALGAAAAQALMQMGRALAVPAEFAGAIAAALADADIVHFGYEGGAGPATYKIYLEYASRVRRAQAQNAPDPVLVHLAYKWMPEAPGQRTVTRYTWVPCRSEAAISARLELLAPKDEAPRALRCGLALMSRAAARTDPGNLLLMEVEEPDNPRRSYDINVYRAELHLRDIADLVGAVATDFAVPQPQVHALLERSGALALGHLSGGRGRDGGEFVTIYYGVEAH